MKCCICKKKIVGYGHNPYPIKTNGRCCDECNKWVVLARLSTYGMKIDSSNDKKVSK